MREIQTSLTERAIQLLNLPEEGMFLLDVGAGSGFNSSSCSSCSSCSCSCSSSFSSSSSSSFSLSELGPHPAHKAQPSFAHWHNPQMKSTFQIDSSRMGDTEHRDSNLKPKP
jgi:hypothetical protein